MKFSSEKSLFRVFNAHFFIVAVALAVGAYIFLTNSGKYVSSIDILLLPKSEKTALQIDKIRENLVLIFEKRRSEIEGDKVIVKAEKGSTIINLKSKNNYAEDAEVISAEAAREVMDTASKYYNVKNDLDIRIVNETIHKKEGNFLVNILIGIFAGALISLIIQILLGVVEVSTEDFFKSKKNASILAGDIKDVFVKNKSRIEKLSFPSYFPERKKEMPVFNFSSEKKEKTEDVDTFANFKKASSPRNLPVEKIRQEESQMIDSAPSNLPFETIADIDSDEYEKKPEPVIIGEAENEPTEEEYRKRLNQLLSGK